LERRRPRATEARADDLQGHGTARTVFGTINLSAEMSFKISCDRALVFTPPGESGAKQMPAPHLRRRAVVAETTVLKTIRSHRNPNSAVNSGGVDFGDLSFWDRAELAGLEGA